MSLGPPAGYADLLDYVMEQEGDNFNAFPLRPSAAGKCTRELGYDLTQYWGYASYEPEQKTPRVKRLLNLGHSIEYSVLQNFNKVSQFHDAFKIKYKQQVVVISRLDSSELDKKEGTQPPLIEGSLDLAVECNGELGFGDVKSAKDGFSKQHKTKWLALKENLSEMQSVETVSPNDFRVYDLKAFLNELDDPFFRRNFYQLNLYCTSQFAKDHGVTHGFIYRYNKNDSDHLEVRFAPSDEVRDEVLTNFNKVYREVRDQGSPENLPRDFPLGSIACHFCDYSDYCRPGQSSSQAFFSQFPKKKFPTKIAKLQDSDNLRRLFEAYEQGLTKQQETTKVEDSIKQFMEEEQIKKIELDNGHVYELKFLKNPKPHTELRRSKR